MSVTGLSGSAGALSHKVRPAELAFRLTHAFVGGRFNPVIPVDAPELAEYLVDRFRVISSSRLPIPSRCIIRKGARLLALAGFDKALFHEAWQHIPPRGAFVDIYHAARSIREARARRRKLLLPTWQDDYPLAAVLLATVGRYPGPSSSVPDYEKMVSEILGTETLVLVQPMLFHLKSGLV